MIIETRGGRQVELRSFALTDMVQWGYGGLRGAGSEVTAKTVVGIPALHRAVRIRAEAVASLRLRCWRGDAPQRAPVVDVWQARLFAGRPNPAQTRFGFWEATEESLAWRGNAFIWKATDPSSGRVVEWWALHPDQVICEPDGYYRVMVKDGYLDPVGKGPATYRVDASTVLHIRGFGDGGRGLAPSPIQVFKDALAVPLARMRREATMWQKGTNIQLGVEFPDNKTQEQVAAWRDMWRETYDGANGETTAILGGGGTLKPIGMTMDQAQWAESSKLTIGDSARIMGVPARFLGLIVERNVPLEQDLDEWLRFGLGTELERIESHLEADAQLFPVASAPVYPAFDTNGFVRGDLATEANIEHQQIQDGSLLIDEARSRRGQDPLPDGLGQIPQIVPVGGAPNPNTTMIPVPAPTP